MTEGKPSKRTDTGKTKWGMPIPDSLPTTESSSGRDPITGPNPEGPELDTPALERTTTRTLDYSDTPEPVPVHPTEPKVDEWTLLEDNYADLSPIEEQALGKLEERLTHTFKLLYENVVREAYRRPFETPRHELELRYFDSRIPELHTYSLTHEDKRPLVEIRKTPDGLEARFPSSSPADWQDMKESLRHLKWLEQTQQFTETDNENIIPAGEVRGILFNMNKPVFQEFIPPWKKDQFQDTQVRTSQPAKKSNTPAYGSPAQGKPVSQAETVDDIAVVDTVQAPAKEKVRTPEHIRLHFPEPTEVNQRLLEAFQAANQYHTDPNKKIITFFYDFNLRGYKVRANVAFHRKVHNTTTDDQLTYLNVSYDPLIPELSGVQAAPAIEVVYLGELGKKKTPAKGVKGFFGGTDEIVIGPDLSDFDPDFRNYKPGIYLSSDRLKIDTWTKAMQAVAQTRHYDSNKIRERGLVMFQDLLDLHTKIRKHYG
ncbi:hypothetical protein ACFL0V_00295 [Nanoarchaeota archaeon]